MGGGPDGPGLGRRGYAADRAWVRELWQALRPYAANEGAYLNFESDTDQPRVRASYGEEKYRRLAALKAAWDPDNVFRHNPNVAPAAAQVPRARENGADQSRGERTLTPPRRRGCGQPGSTS